jgi:phosphoribosylamine--glycine ligase
MAGETLLLVGNGGREGAIAEAIADSAFPPDVLYYTGANVGIDGLADRRMQVMQVDCDIKNVQGIVDAAKSIPSDPQKLTVVVGPEAPLVAGAADRLRGEGIHVFGPSAEAAKLEGSKIFATKFMRENRIAHPGTMILESGAEAEKYLLTADPESIVLKADGLAGGKGVVLPKTREEMMKVAQDMLSGEAFDGAGKTGILVQERLTGPEVSVFVVADGRGGYSIIPYFAQDHKRLEEGDKGPNTGGMGAYSPLPDGYLTEKQLAGIEDIVQKTIEGMEKRGTPYQGTLYLGLMMAEQRAGAPVVIEYNCRFGDPEAQVVLPLMTRNGLDVYDMFYSTARGEAPAMRPARHLGGSALTVTLAAAGYPGKPATGAVIHGLDHTYPNTQIYHGGTKRINEQTIITNGGRVLYVTGMGRDVDEAAAAAYAAIGGPDGIYFEGMQVRDDIGHRIRKHS